jgi:hypothetical protein
MGNTSVVASGVKAQGTGKELYNLVAIGDGGELVTLMKEASKTRDYSKLDEAIKTKV